MSCLCPSCRPQDPAPTYTEAYRHECEVRYVVSLGTQEDRRKYLAGVAKRRGLEAMSTLRNDAIRLWEKR